MQAGLVVLRLRPADFWSLTPIELQIMLGLAKGQAPMGRDRLDALVSAFPDVKKDPADG